MGRSKFPGKPPKTVTRKRIKVLGRPQAAQSDSVTVAENIYYGHSLFHDAFGDNEKVHHPFHGFSSKEAQLSESYITTKNHDLEKNIVTSGSSGIVIKPGKKDEKQKILSRIDNKKNNLTESEQLDLTSKNLNETVEKNLSTSIESYNEVVKDDSNEPKLNKSVSLPSVAVTPVLKTVNNILDRHQRTRHLRNSTAKRLLQRAKFNINTNNRSNGIHQGDKSTIIRKFVLPIRSAHSSRVIKPNKRFIEELEENTTSTECNKNRDSIGAHINAKKVKTQQNCESSSCKNNERNLRNKSKKSPFCTNSQTTNRTPRSKESLTDSLSRQSGSKKSRNNLPNKLKIPIKNMYCKSDISEFTRTISSFLPTVLLKRQPDKTLSTNIEQITAPVEDITNQNIPVIESSRIQTRSGTNLSESSLDQNSDKNSKNINEFVDSTEDNPPSTHCNIKNIEKDGIVNAEEMKNHVQDDSQSDNFESDSSLSESHSDQNNHSEDEESEWTGTKLDGGKVILRKARLKLDNKNSGGTEGPFSVSTQQNNSNGNNANAGLTGTVKCGVCGAVRFYRFVKQARKFGIYSCESCRKFISKMIKRQTCVKSNNSVSLPILQCHKGDGLCLVPPVVRSQQWNLMRCVYKARCPACWLKMCLNCYNIPSTLKSGLNSLLPVFLRDPVISSNLENNDGQKSIGSKINWPAEENSGKNIFKSTISWNGMEIGSKTGTHNNVQGVSPKNFEKYECSMTISPGKKRKKDNRIKVRKKIKSSLLLLPPSLSTSSNIIQASQGFRQKVDLKGPRVKHVCRSASVALGQPFATFPTGDGKEEMANTIKNASKMRKEVEKTVKKDETILTEKECKKMDTDDIICNSNVSQSSSYTKKTKNLHNILAPNNQVMRALSKTTDAETHTISIDFWERYDPAEVGADGFALIGSEPFHIPAICFLCGSAGKEPLIHCQCCVEPYHTFCLEPSEWNACAQPNWSCPRCTICQTCHLRIGPKLSCIRCRQSFHHACLSKSGVNARLYSPDRPYVCQSCVKCKSCGSNGVSIYVGNLPLCSMCFKLRQRGNYCPLCQRSYNENDFDSKMMECSDCSCWVHAHCERLSDESYQVLSYLPDSIEFTCSQCFPNPNSIWRNAIENELKSGFISVIKALSRNRKMCVALKWSPRKECLCRPLVSVRKLNFSDEKISQELDNESEDNCNNEKSRESDTSIDSKMDSLKRYDFECDDHQSEDVPRRGLRRLKQKYHLKECSVRVKNCVPKDSQDDGLSQESASSNNRECQCSELQIITRPSPTLMSVKRKVNGNEYRSLSQFHCDMEYVVNRAGAQDLIESYYKLIQEVFPWFDPKCSRINLDECSFSTPVKNSIKNISDSPALKLDDSIVEAWKEELLRAPKAIAAKTGNIYSNITMEDNRICALCKGLGDGLEIREGRLLYCGQNEWVHSNCALWSNEVFEEIDGSLQNVHSAISRGRLIRCSECGKKGASVGCCAKTCNSTYHFPCARNIGLGFNEDKTIFCTAHLANGLTGNSHTEENFELTRLVYVELDRKKKKYVEPHSAKIMIGSLTINYLGTIIPELSDTPGKIIPTNYQCSRLYWSTVNPMKIVRYYIKTYVQTCTNEIIKDVEHNVTIDHTKELEKQEKQKRDQIVIKQTLDAMIDSVYNKEVDENLAEQNNTDLLPPEITDAIFEDLPHDLLDGISMQDIFPKMSYEDFLAMDLKNDGVFSSDLLKDEILPSETDENKMMKIVDSTISDSTSPNDFWLHLETKGSVHDFVDDILNSRNQKVGGRELKRSKSEVMTNNQLIGPRHHQRSCSLTWSCKVDGTYGPTVKMRKLPRSPTAPICGDVQNEKTSLFHELRIPESIMVAVGMANTQNFISESNKDHKRLVWHTRQQPRLLQVDGSADPSSASECSSPEYNTEERIPQVDGSTDERFCNNKNWFCYKVNKQLEVLSNRDSNNDFSEIKITSNKIPCDEFKIPQLDGADDVSSDDENLQNSGDGEVTYVEVMDVGVTCKRCQCTYRTQDSYNRHLTSCDIITTSDSDSETVDNKIISSDTTRSLNCIGTISPQFETINQSNCQIISPEYCEVQMNSSLNGKIPSSYSSISTEGELINPQIQSHATVETVHQTVLTSNDVIVQTQYMRTTTTLPNKTVLPSTSSSSSSPENTNPITDIIDTVRINNQNFPLIERDEVTNLITNTQVSPTISNNNNNNNMIIGAADGTSISINSSALKTSKPKSPRTTKNKTKVIKPQATRNFMSQQLAPVRYHQTIQNTTPVQLQIQQPSRTTAPTVILQQVPQSGMMSAYVETLQQQAGPNLQYITAIGGQETGYKPQFITTNQLVPGTYIQTGSDNLLALPNGGISVLPGVQIAHPQPTVLGTIIQQQPSTIQCGVIASEQLVLSSTPTLEMFTDSTGSMFVSSQPMYYGLETIVSNTVMSSSQFVAGAMPQVLASSYQTTTQVFQASKLMEPMVDVQTMPNPTTVQTMSNVQNIPNVQSVHGVTSSVPTVRTVQNIPGIPNIPGGYVVVNPSTSDGISSGINIAQNITSNDQTTFVRQACNPVSIIESRRPMQSISPLKTNQSTIVNIPRVAVRPSPVFQNSSQVSYDQWKNPEPTTFVTEQSSVNNIMSSRPYLDSKHVSENTSMITSSISPKISPSSSHCITQKEINVGNSLNYNLNVSYSNIHNNVLPSVNENTLSPVISSDGQNKITPAIPVTRPMNRVLPMQAVAPKQENIKNTEKFEIHIEEPTKPECKFFNSDFIPKTDKHEIVRETVEENFFIEKSLDIEQPNIVGKSLPLIDEEDFDNNGPVIISEKSITTNSNSPLRESLVVIEEEKSTEDVNQFLETQPVEVSPSLDDDEIKLNSENIEESKENLEMDIEKEKPPNKSLKIVLQKQLEDGSYKIAQNMTSGSNIKDNKKSPKITSMEIFTSKQTPQISPLQLLPIKTFTLNKIDNKQKNLDKEINSSEIKESSTAIKKSRLMGRLDCANNKIDLEKINKNKKIGPKLMYEIKSQDGFSHTAASMAEVWDAVFQAVQTARKTHNLPPLAHNPLTEDLGLNNNSTVYLVEQLAGVNRCTKYKPRFHTLSPPKSRDLDVLAESVNGAVRAEPFKGRKVHDMFSWLASRHRQQPKIISITETEMRKAVSTNLPMAMRFRILKETSKESVGVYHSHIHGRGLFCLRDIEAGEMVIEYAGEVIRASLTDKREKYYDSKNIGCYMFKIDDHLVVDATMKGNAARFINHSCEPNCYSKVVDILGKKHILIFALRRIIRGEELTYDYKFPFEDIKIPCTCGSRRCRKYLN